MPAANDAGPVTDSLSNGVTGVCCRESAVKEGSTAVITIRVNVFYANPYRQDCVQLFPSEQLPCARGMT